MPVETLLCAWRMQKPWALYTSQHDRARIVWWLTDHECTRRHTEHMLTAVPTAQVPTAQAASQHALPGWAGQSSSSSAAASSCTATVASSAFTSSPSCASRSDSTSTLACSSPEHRHMCVWVTPKETGSETVSVCVCEREREGEESGEPTQHAGTHPGLQIVKR